jgi:hypothetical protein
MERVNIVVSPTMKAAWEDHAEAEWGGNMSAMIRHAVQQEVTSNGGPGEAVDLDPVLDRLDDIAGAVDSLGGWSAPSTQAR